MKDGYIGDYMREKIYEKKWNTEKINSIVEILGDHIIYRRGALGFWYPDGTGKGGITDPEEIEIEESMIGGSVYHIEIIEAFGNSIEDRYVLCLNESLYEPIWADITRIKGGVTDYFDTYEAVVNAAKDLAQGKRPINYLSCHTQKNVCCYCCHWNGDRQIDSNRELWQDPDIKSDCDIHICGKKMKRFPDDEACEKYEMIDLEELWKEAQNNKEKN